VRARKQHAAEHELGKRGHRAERHAHPVGRRGIEQLLHRHACLHAHLVAPRVGRQHPVHAAEQHADRHAWRPAATAAVHRLARAAARVYVGRVGGAREGDGAVEVLVGGAHLEGLPRRSSSLRVGRERARELARGPRLQQRGRLAGHVAVGRAIRWARGLGLAGRGRGRVRGPGRAGRGQRARRRARPVAAATRARRRAPAACGRAPRRCGCGGAAPRSPRSAPAAAAAARGARRTCAARAQQHATSSSAAPTAARRRAAPRRAMVRPPPPPRSASKGVCRRPRALRSRLSRVGRGGLSNLSASATRVPTPPFAGCVVSGGSNFALMSFVPPDDPGEPVLRRAAGWHAGAPGWRVGRGVWMARDD
jgi:hypothetical protein